MWGSRYRRQWMYYRYDVVNYIKSKRDEKQVFYVYNKYILLKTNLKFI